MTKPIQVYLEPGQHQRLKILAVQRGTNISEIVRSLIDVLLLEELAK